MATRDRAQPDRRRRHPGRDRARRRCGRTTSMYADALLGGPRVLHGRRRAPPPAVATASARTPRSQDAYNLAWKLALVLDGKADPVAAATPTTRSARRSASRSSRARTRASRSSGRSSRRSGCSTPTIPSRWGRTSARPQGGHAGGGRAAREARGARSSSRTTSSTRTASSSASATARPRSSRTARPSRRSRAIPSCTTTRRPGPARGCRTAGWSTNGQAVSTLDLAGKGRFAAADRASAARPWRVAAAAVTRAHRRRDRRAS